MKSPKLSRQEIDDMISALTFFVREYKPKAPETKKAMRRLEKKLWKALRS